MTHKLYKTKEDIENWLNKYQITNYQLIEDKEYGYVVDVNKNVILSNVKLDVIKVKFNIVNGIFDCSGNKLRTLKGCPKTINGSFNCSNNQLKKLEGCPEIIKGFFYCIETTLNTLEYFPKQVNRNCHLHNNPELGEIQKIKDFNELKKIHELIVLNKKLEKEITIDNARKNDKIKL